MKNPKKKKSVKFINTSMADPFIISTQSKNFSKVMLINSPQVGLLYPKNTFENPVTNSLRLAQAEKCDAIIIAGNVVYMDTKQYSSNKPYRSRIIDIMMDDCSDDTKEPIFLDYKEKFNQIIEQVKSFFTHNGNAIFDGPIYIVLGSMEEEIALKYANLEVVRKVFKKRNEINFEIMDIKRKLKKAKANDEDTCVFEEKIKSLERELSKVKASYIDDNYVNKITEEMRNYIAFGYEEAIPNTKVIASGSTHFKINNIAYHIDHNSGGSIQDTGFGKKIASIRQSSKLKDHADFIFVGGYRNLTYSGLPVSYRSRKKDMTSVTPQQLPILLNSKFIKKYAEEMVHSGDSLIKLVKEADFTTGVMIHEIVNGIPKEKHFSIDCLTNKELFKSKKALLRMVNGKNTFYQERESDLHYGHPWQAFYEVPQKPYVKYHNQVVHDLLLGMDAPICAYNNTGDILQGHHFPSEKQRNLECNDVQREIESLGNSNIPVDEKYRITQRLYAKLGILRGRITIDEQKELYRREAIEYSQAYFYKILKRAEKIGLTTVGDLGIISLVSGNHFDNTVEGELRESVEIADIMKDVLLNNHRDFSREQINELVKAPMFGSSSVVNGAMGILPSKARGKLSKEELLQQDDHYLYAIYARHKPIAGSSKYNDPLRKTRIAFSKRGTTEVYQQGRHTLVFWGHTHYGGKTFVPGADLVGCGSQTFNDSFGEKHAYPLNNIYSEIIGLHKDGPKWGPRIYIQFRYEELKHYVQHPWKIDKDKLFSNALC